RSDSGSAGELTVDLQSGPVNGIHFLLIKSSQYGDGRNIVFRTSGDGTTFGGSPITLAGPQFYSGGAVEHLDPDPRFLRFTNNSGEEARIEIFIARDATP
ncbi:MAG TPA: hypothetical protein PL128_11480, partial [Ginsengibacter sp.]|nr:hypothetical protein [Ginsengibacter sp.]